MCILLCKKNDGKSEILCINLSINVKCQKVLKERFKIIYTEIRNGAEWFRMSWKSHVWCYQYKKKLISLDSLFQNLEDYWLLDFSNPKIIIKSRHFLNFKYLGSFKQITTVYTTENITQNVWTWLQWNYLLTKLYFKTENY